MRVHPPVPASGVLNETVVKTLSFLLCLSDNWAVEQVGSPNEYWYLLKSCEWAAQNQISVVHMLSYENVCCTYWQFFLYINADTIPTEKFELRL